MYLLAALFGYLTFYGRSKPCSPQNFPSHFKAGKVVLSHWGTSAHVFSVGPNPDVSITLTYYPVCNLLNKRWDLSSCQATSSSPVRGSEAPTRGTTCVSLGFVNSDNQLLSAWLLAKAKSDHAKNTLAFNSFTWLYEVLPTLALMPLIQLHLCWKTGANHSSVKKIWMS